MGILFIWKLQKKILGLGRNEPHSCRVLLLSGQAQAYLLFVLETVFWTRSCHYFKSPCTSAQSFVQTLRRPLQFKQMVRYWEKFWEEENEHIHLHNFLHSVLKTETSNL